MSAPVANTGPLAGIRVLDLSRVLAGPWCTQMFGDLGAEVIKVEQPGQGDDTRRWGPPWVPDGSRDSAYYLCTNRNKRSIAVDIASPEGAELIRKIAATSDIVVENFRVGGLVKYGLDYETIKAINPGVIWCSITGFGQTGPLKDEGGYDFLIQGMSGLMSVTGRPDGTPGEGPLKVGIAISDLVTGLYAASSVLAALHHRDQTGEGQQVDIALLDAQVALLTNQASNYLNGGMVPRRLGNQHPNMVPYQDFTCADGEILIATGNDRQFRSLCALLGLDVLGSDERFATVSARSINRAALLEYLEPAIATRQADDLIAQFRLHKVPGGRINDIPQVLEHPQVEHRQMVREIERSDGTPIKFIGFPARLSQTPASYRHAPPRSAEDTAAVLAEALGLDNTEIQRLLESGVIAEKL
ncbi:MAG: CoA transferase [Erythrobacter sp.]|nr:CoA transferase [Erythrobacter sp.]